MLSIREQLALGHLCSKVQKDVKIPKKSAFLGTITDEGYCDYDVPEESWYLDKDMTKAHRLMKSVRARNQRKKIRMINNLE